MWDDSPLCAFTAARRKQVSRWSMPVQSVKSGWEDSCRCMRMNGLNWTKFRRVILPQSWVVETRPQAIPSVIRGRLSHSCPWTFPNLSCTWPLRQKARRNRINCHGPSASWLKKILLFRSVSMKRQARPSLPAWVSFIWRFSSTECAGNSEWKAMLGNQWLPTVKP